jgi:site-specific recombinase XerD
MRKQAHKVSALTPEQLASILKLAAERSARDHAMILVQYFHGLRASELVSLKVSHFSLKNPGEGYLDRRQKLWFLHVWRLKGSLETRQEVCEVKGKPHWNEKQALEKYIQEHRPKDVGTDLIFLSRKTDLALEREAWNRIFKAYAKEAGVPSNLQHNHCLKHSRAKHLLEAHSSLDHVRQSMGHSSLNSTILYTRTTDQDADIAARSALRLLP